MTGFTAIDLSRLPVPNVIEPIDTEIQIAGMKAAVLEAAPETLVDEVIEAFAQRYDIKVEASGQQRESIVFNLPRELRVPTAEAKSEIPAA